MKKIILFGLSLLALAFMVCSCKHTNETDDKDKTILAERIQYDVLIKSPDPDLNWWVQNIEGSKRETFVKTILQLAYDGKVKAYNYDNMLLTPLQVKNFDADTEKVSLPDATNPDKFHDTTIINRLDIQEITKVRFLEEWYLDEKKPGFDKKVVGVMLMKETLRDSTKFNVPLFWIYFDDKYPAKLK